MDSNKRRIRVGLLFGGRSAEHEVSLQSAKSILQAIDREKYEPILIGIDKDGRWHFSADQKVLPDNELTVITSNGGSDNIVTLMPGDRNNSIVAIDDPTHQATVDIVFPVLHGPMGEDGTIQGLLELANIPYVGPNVLGSAIGMDKDVMKRLLRDNSIAVADFEIVRTANLSDEQANEIIIRYGLPLFVKPANMGSSVGVSKVSSIEELRPAITEALKFDLKALIEQSIVGDEIECSVLGNDNPRASVIGRVIPKDSFYSYEAKYIDENGAVLEIPADIDPNVAEKAREVAVKAFMTLACEGMSRVDMFVTKDGEIVVNEINTIPGFTKISMYPKLWEKSGVSYTELISTLIDLAVERFERRQKLQTTYEGHI